MGKHAAINKKSNNSNNPDRPTNGKGYVCFDFSNIYYFFSINYYWKGFAFEEYDHASQYVQGG